MKESKILEALCKCPFLAFLVVSGMGVCLYFSLRAADMPYSRETAEMMQAQAETEAEKAADNEPEAEEEKNTAEYGNDEVDDESETGQEAGVSENNAVSENSAYEQAESATEDGSVSENAAEGGNATVNEKDTVSDDSAKNEQNEKGGAETEFLYYTPTSTNSPYYTDPGRIAMTTGYAYGMADADYFADAAFIGDSRTLGLYDYGGMDGADFYCDNGYCTFRWAKGKGVVCQNTKQTVSLDERMGAKKYGKIYIMLGLNDCGYGNIDDFSKRYQKLLDMLRTKQPDAVIYLMANLHLSKEKSDSDAVYNNVDVNAHNVAAAELADGVSIFYLNTNELFLDERQNLKAELTFDGAHLYAAGYRRLADYIRQHAVVR